MALVVVFAPLAEADLDAIVEYIARDNPDAAHRFGRDLLAQARSLASNPYWGGCDTAA